MKTENQLANAFLSTLAQIRKGQTTNELSEQMASVVQSVRLTGKTGSLTLKLVVSPNKDGVSVNVEDVITVKVPRMERAATLFYATEDGVLQRDDPHQVELQFTSVQGGKAALNSEEAALNSEAVAQ
jgi:vacuolar-type H+-ATPase subunit D/Vma8